MLGNAGVFILGRNWMALPLIVLFSAPIFLSVDFMFFTTSIDPWEEPVIVVLMFLLLLLGVFGIGYFLHGLNVRTEIMFSDTSLSWKRCFLIGSKVQYFNYTDLESINFSVYTPYRSFFKCVRISLTRPDAEDIHLIQKDSPMYSWQGRKAYHRLKTMLAANNRTALLAPEPDFSWEGDAAYKRLFSNEGD